MKIPTIHGFIDRRILINFTAEPEVVSKVLPSPFRPKIYGGMAIVGICLIRLKNIKPKGLPDFIGISSENGAHRIAIEWDEDGEVKQGVFIPRRDTSLKLNALAGGRIFPGKHYLAKFNVVESVSTFHIDFTSSDKTSIAINARQAEFFDSNSIFGTLENASAFFEKGELGYSPNKAGFDGLKLQAYHWKVKPLEVTNVQSSYFEDDKLFPRGSVKFDNALLMTNIEHEWHSVQDKKTKLNIKKNEIKRNFMDIKNHGNFPFNVHNPKIIKYKYFWNSMPNQSPVSYSSPAPLPLFS